MIVRRRVLYIGGYDPQGVEGYYTLFRQSRNRFHDVWQCRANVGERKVESELVAHWDVQASGPNWQVTTHYEFLRLEHIVRAEMAEPVVRQVPRAIAWALDYLVSGTTVRVLLASWRFALHLLYFQVALLLGLGLAVASGWLAAHAAADFVGSPRLLALAVGVLAGVATFVILRPLAHRSRVLQGNSCWSSLSRFARGRETGLEGPIKIGAERLVAAARANDVDEIVVIGHSWGGAIAPAVVASALELDPDVGRRGPRLVLLTLGSIMAAAALHPGAVRLHEAIRRLAAEPSLRWLECQSRKDVLSCWKVDPVEGIGIELGRKCCNPLLWQVRMRDMIRDDVYGRLRWNFLRIHYQFIMANDRRAPYDYFMLTCGPVPIEQWAARGRDLVAAFSQDGSCTLAAVARAGPSIEVASSLARPSKTEPVDGIEAAMNSTF